MSTVFVVARMARAKTTMPIKNKNPPKAIIKRCFRVMYNVVSPINLEALRYAH